MSSLCYYWVGTILTNQVSQSYAAMLNELRSSIDEQFKKLNDLTVQLSCTPWVKKIMYMQGDSFDYNYMDCVELNNHVLELKGYDIINEFIDVVTLVFPKQQFIVSSTGAEEVNYFFDNTYEYSAIDFKNLASSLSQNGGAQILQTTASFNNIQDEKILTYAQLLPTLGQSNNAFLISNINNKVFSEKLKKYLIIKNSSILVLDQSGKVIIDSMATNTVIENPVTLEVGEKNIINLNKKKYFVFTKTSSVNNWKYVVLMPYDVVMEKVNYMKVVTNSIIILLTLGGIILSYLLSSYNFNPLLNLVDTMKNRFSDRDVSISNEYDFLQKYLKLLISEEDMLRKQTERQKPFMRNAFIMQILRGSVENDTSIEVFKSLDISFPYENFTACLFVIDNICAITDGLQQKANNLSSQHNAKVYLAEDTGVRKISVINIQNLQDLKDLVSKLKDLLVDELNTGCIVGVGKSVNSIHGISRAYEEAVKAIDYKGINDITDIVYFEDVSSINNSYYYYPMEMENQIMNALRLANNAETIKFIDEIIHMNLNDNFNLNSGRYLFYDIIGSFMKVLYDLKLTNEIIIQKNFIENAEKLHQIQEYLKELSKNICDLIKSNKVSEYDILKINMIKYTDEHIGDPNLSLEALGEYLDKSVSYVSKFFKDNMGCNFLDYINKKRIAKAKELLNGQMTIMEIAYLVGYTNDVTFRRVFRRYENKTPSEYILENNF